MTNRRRFILFTSLVILFIIIAPSILFYSLGWRLDVKTGKINQPGIFYLKINPKNAQIFLDGKFKKKTDFFFGSLMIEKLTAKKYEVTVKKDGFYDWQKTLEIKNGQATEAKNIVLIPNNPNITVLFKNIDSLFLAPDEKRMILKEESETGWSLKLYEGDKNIKSHIADEKDLIEKAGLDAKNTSIESFGLVYSKNSKNVLLEAKIKQTGIKSKNQPAIGSLYYILDIDKSPSSITYINAKEEVKEITFSPNDDKILFFISQTKENENYLNKFDINKQDVIKILPEEILAYTISENSIYYLDSSGVIFETDFDFNKHEKTYSLENSLEKNAEYELAVSSLALVMKENNSLYYLDRKTNNFSKVADQVKSFKLSSDSKKLAYSNNYEIFVLFLEADESQPQKKAGDQTFLTRFSEKLGKVSWYTDYYLIFNIEDKIKVIEIDDRDRINIVDLASYKNPDIFWSQTQGKLYILSEETLFSSDKLIQ